MLCKKLKPTTSKGIIMKSTIEKFKNAFFASCPTGLEAILAQEIKDLGAKEVVVTKGGAHFESFPEIAIKVIMFSGVASRVYKKIYGFEIKVEKDIYYNAKEIKWKSIFNLDQTFRINTIQGKSPEGTKRSKFENSMYLGQLLKDAIADRFREDTKERPYVDKVSPDMSFLMRVEPNDNPHSQKENVTILIDMCGNAVSNRGYRVKSFSAPLRENLAYGILKLAGYDGSQTLVDGMCGSGTFLAEAAIIKYKLPPCFIHLQNHKEFGDELPWAFLDHIYYSKDTYLKENTEKLIEETQKSIDAAFLTMKPEGLYGFDDDEGALEIATYNLKIANLLDAIQLECADITKVSKPNEDGGIFIANPPYGERLGEEEELGDLYHEVGENLKNNFKDYKAYILTGNLPLLKKISLRTSKKEILYNGNIESRLAEYLLY
jgi:23S rRNA G2445 N2-methylase RlmL